MTQSTEVQLAGGGQESAVQIDGSQPAKICLAENISTDSGSKSIIELKESRQAERQRRQARQALEKRLQGLNAKFRTGFSNPDKVSECILSVSACLLRCLGNSVSHVYMCVLGGERREDDVVGGFT